VAQKAHHIEAVVDRVIVRDGVRPRLAESIHLAIRHGGGLVVGAYETKSATGGGRWQERLFSTEYACPRCKISYEEIQPRTFSFNSPYGACRAAKGSAPANSSTRTSSCPTRGCRWRRVPWRPGGSWRARSASRPVRSASFSPRPGFAANPLEKLKPEPEDAHPR